MNNQRANILKEKHLVHYKLKNSDFVKKLKERANEASERQKNLLSQAERFGEPRYDERGILMRGKGDELRDQAAKAARDLYDSSWLMAVALNDHDEASISLTREQSRWLYACSAPDSVRTLIGEWPEE